MNPGMSPLYVATVFLLILHVSATEPRRAINGNAFLGYNVVNLRSGNFSDAPYLEATAALNPGILRYPGGNIADWWDWRTGCPSNFCGTHTC